MNFAKKMAMVGALTACLAAGSAQAAFVFVDTVTPVGSAATAISPINDFRSQLAANGVPNMFLGRSLSVTGAVAGDQVNVDFFAAEAGFRNQFILGTSTLVNNQGNLGWAERDLGNFNVVNGVLDFRFCAVTIGTCLTNRQNDSTRFGSLQSIGMYLSSDRNTAWLLWDDSGADSDDNHDDLIVRLTYRSVPEPGTLALLGLGLVGVGLARRKRAKA